MSKGLFADFLEKKGNGEAEDAKPAPVTTVADGQPVVVPLGPAKAWQAQRTTLCTEAVKHLVTNKHISMAEVDPYRTQLEKDILNSPLVIAKVGEVAGIDADRLQDEMSSYPRLDARLFSKAVEEWRIQHPEEWQNVRTLGLVPVYSNQHALTVLVEHHQLVPGEDVLRILRLDLQQVVFPVETAISSLQEMLNGG